MVPNSRLSMVSLCAVTWEYHRHHLKLSELLVLHGRRSLVEIHQNDMREPWFLSNVDYSRFLGLPFDSWRVMFVIIVIQFEQQPKIDALMFCFIILL